MFIRTKDGVYETRENGETYNGFGCKFNNGTIKIHKKDILNQSENLDELCDDFVYDKQGYEAPQRCYQNFRDIWFDVQSLSHLTDKEISTIKGGIWTDEGFIYVAQMNSNKNLELI